MNTTKAKSIHSSRMASRHTSKMNSRKGSFDGMEDEVNNKEEVK